MKYTVDTSTKTIEIDNAYFNNTAEFISELKSIEELFPNYKISIYQKQNLSTFGGGIQYYNSPGVGVPNDFTVTCSNSDLLKS